MLRVLTAPLFYALELTPACNNRCPGCSNSFWEHTLASKDCWWASPLQIEGWLQILDSIAPHAQRLKITGGEPTLHPDFSEILTAIDDRGIDFTVFTNARWQNRNELVDFLRQRTHMTGLLVSLHGARASSHEAFTGVLGSFEETLTNVRLVIQQEVPVALSTVLTTHNANELPDLVALAQELGVRTVVFNRYMGSPIPGLTPAEEVLRAVIETVEGLRRDGLPVKYGNCIPQCFTPNSSVGCMAGVAYCAIDPWGYLRPCTLSSLRAGNLRDHRLEDLWHSPVMEAFRATIPEDCHHCSAFSVCHGGCKALALETDSPADPLARVGEEVVSPLPVQVVVDQTWRPVAEFEVRTEPWGLVLLRGNQLLPVRHEARPLLDALNGHASVGELQKRFGETALSLIGTLYHRNMITFSS